MMPRILFLTVRMQPGYGVAVVITEVARRLRQRGVEVLVGCQQRDGDFGALPVRRVEATADALQALAAEFQASHVIAHSSPYFEALPGLRGLRCWAWEHGDPDPEFFERSRAERAAQIQRKKTAVYPNLDGVIAISEFIREQIGWPAAHIVRNGWEHVLAEPTANAAERLLDAAPGALKVGCLMRLGEGEERYKGGALYRQLAAACPGLHFSLMGRGEARDEAPYREAGIQVLRNASDAQRAAYLDDIDVFVSPSLWEGCNLPLLEAQARGTAALAFDSGAHPEHATGICGSVEDMARLLRHWQQRRDLLEAESRRARDWVRQRFSWDRATDEVLEAILQG